MSMVRIHLSYWTSANVTNVCPIYGRKRPKTSGDSNAQASCGYWVTAKRAWTAMDASPADPKRQTSRARDDQLQAHPGVAGPADHGRERLFRLRLDELDRAAGASPHAARRDRQAQCPDQRGPEIGGAQIRARQT